MEKQCCLNCFHYSRYANYHQCTVGYEVAHIEKNVKSCKCENWESVEEETEDRECPICEGEYIFDGFEDTWNCCNCGHSEVNQG